MLFTVQGAELLFFLCLLRLIQGYTCILLDEVRKVLCDNSQFLFQAFLLCAKGVHLTDRFNQFLQILYGFLFLINQGIQCLEEHLLDFFLGQMRCVAGRGIFAVLPIAAVDDLPVLVGGMPHLGTVPSTTAPTLDFV